MGVKLSFLGYVFNMESIQNCMCIGITVKIYQLHHMYGVHKVSIIQGQQNKHVTIVWIFTSFCTRLRSFKAFIFIKIMTYYCKPRPFCRYFVSFNVTAILPASLVPRSNNRAHTIHFILLFAVIWFSCKCTCRKWLNHYYRQNNCLCLQYTVMNILCTQY